MSTDVGKVWARCGQALAVEGNREAYNPSFILALRIALEEPPSVPLDEGLTGFVVGPHLGDQRQAVESVSRPSDPYYIFYSFVVGHLRDARAFKQLVSCQKIDIRPMMAVCLNRHPIRHHGLDEGSFLMHPEEDLPWRFVPRSKVPD
ncbi:hypothetical protein ACX80I_12590 [Arthrobacter sp. MDT3-44]